MSLSVCLVGGFNKSRHLLGKTLAERCLRYNWNTSVLSYCAPKPHLPESKKLKIYTHDYSHGDFSALMPSLRNADGVVFLNDWELTKEEEREFSDYTVELAKFADSSGVRHFIVVDEVKPGVQQEKGLIDEEVEDRLGTLSNSMISTVLRPGYIYDKSGLQGIQPKVGELWSYCRSKIGGSEQEENDYQCDTEFLSDVAVTLIHNESDPNKYRVMDCRNMRSYMDEQTSFVWTDRE